MFIYTIGFTKKSAEQFFTLLNAPGLARIIDVRLNNTSNLYGFSKRDDLAFFLCEINDLEYMHLPILAPTQDILDDFKKKRIDWPTYKLRFESLLVERQVEGSVDRNIVNGGCLLCSEPTPEKCHRRLVAEYFRDCWGDLEIIHL